MLVGCNTTKKLCRAVLPCRFGRVTHCHWLQLKHDVLPCLVALEVLRSWQRGGEALQALLG